MKYRLEQQLFSRSGRFQITNEDGEDVGHIDHEWSLRGRMRFYDVAGNERAMIQTASLIGPPMYEIYRDGYLSAVIHHERFLAAGPRYTIDLSATQHLQIEGDFPGYEYFFTYEGKAVGQVSRAWFAMADSYGIEILDDQDAVLLIACTAVIDIALHHRA